MKDGLLQEGDVIKIEEGHAVYANAPEHFLYSNRRGSFKMAHGYVIVGGELLYLSGIYVVTKTAFDGGGDSHDGGFPDGHHVFCVKKDDKDVKIDFYQTGCFTAMIKDIKPIGKANLQWVIEG